jgi:hypothetical protein
MDVGRSPYPIGKQVATGVTTSLQEALELVEDYALNYLSDELEKVTVPFWIEEATWTIHRERNMDATKQEKLTYANMKGRIRERLDYLRMNDNYARIPLAAIEVAIQTTDAEVREVIAEWKREAKEQLWFRSLLAGDAHPFLLNTPQALFVPGARHAFELIKYVATVVEPNWLHLGDLAANINWSASSFWWNFHVFRKSSRNARSAILTLEPFGNFSL